ncbi:MAG TPA: protoporphyrinogen oxidase [Vicinamibacterales bacterium]
MSRIVVAGAGVTGLSIARAIRRRDPRVDVIVLEGNAQPGGNVKTERVDGYLCEWGADGFLDNAPDTLALVREIGLESRLLPSRDTARRRFIYSKGVLHEVPVSPQAFIKSGLLSVRGKARIAWEPFARRRPESDETIHDFAARRIGEEAASVMIDSMVSGIFAGDATALSLRACFPKMWQMESDHGGLFRAMLATRKRRKKEDAMGAPAGHLTSFVDGMAELIQALAGSLGTAVRTSSPVIELQRGRRTEALRPGHPTGYTVMTPQGPIEADAVVLTGPSSEAASLVRPFDSTLATLLAGIATAPLAVLCLGFDEAALVRDRGELNGFGFLVPRREQIRLLGALWETAIYPNRAPEGKALMRVMIGGARDPGAVDLDDETLLSTVRSELKQTMGLRIAPEFVRIVRHRRGIPQYLVGHVARLQRIDALLQAHPGLVLAGNSYRGVSINSCVAESDAIAEPVLAHLQGQGAARVETPRTEVCTS